MLLQTNFTILQVYSWQIYAVAPPTPAPPGCRLPEEEKHLKMSVLIDRAAKNQQTPACKPKEEGSISNAKASISAWN